MESPGFNLKTHISWNRCDSTKEQRRLFDNEIRRRKQPSWVRMFCNTSYVMERSTDKPYVWPKYYKRYLKEPKVY